MTHQSSYGDQIAPLPWGIGLLRRLIFPRKLGVLEHLYGATLADQGGRALVELANGICWQIDLSEVTHRWMIYGDYEGPVQMRWLKNWLKCGGIFVDSGANIG